MDVVFGSRASATTLIARSRSVTMPASFFSSLSSTIGIGPTSSDFINWAAAMTESVGRQHSGFFVMISLAIIAYNLLPLREDQLGSLTAGFGVLLPIALDLQPSGLLLFAFWGRQRNFQHTITERSFRFLRLNALGKWETTVELAVRSLAPVVAFVVLVVFILALAFDR